MGAEVVSKTFGKNRHLKTLANAISVRRLELAQADLRRRDAENEYIRTVAELVGDENFEITYIMCNPSPWGHIFYPDHTLHGVGKRHCVLCGADDFED